MMPAMQPVPQHLTPCASSMRNLISTLLALAPLLGSPVVARPSVASPAAAPSAAQPAGPGAPAQPRAAAAASAPLAGPPPQAPAALPASMTEAELVAMALQRNRSLQVAHKQVEEALHAWRAASTLPGASVALAYQNGTSPNTNNYGTRDLYATVTQALPPAGSLLWSSRAAREGYEAARSNELQARLVVTQSARDAFAALLVAQQQLQGAQESLAIASRLHELVHTRFKNGACPRMDLLNAELQRATAEQGLILAQSTQRQARAALIPVLGGPVADELTVEGSLELPTLEATLEGLLERARTHHPQLAAARHGVEQGAAQARATAAQRNPAAQLSYLYDATQTTVAPLYSLSAQLSFPIDYGQISHTVKQQQAATDERRAALEGTGLSLEASVRSAWAAWQAARQNVATFRLRVLEPATRILAMTELGYKEGALSYQQVLSAQQNLQQARVQQASMLLSGHQALHALEAAVGSPLAEARP